MHAIDSVRTLRAVTGLPLDAWLADSVGAPYIPLARIRALGAGRDAATEATESLRAHAARLGANAVVIHDVRKQPVGPYTAAAGLGIRVLPPMPDAAARCASLAAPAHAAARIVACREAIRQEPRTEAHRAGFVVARLAYFERLHGRPLERTDMVSRDAGNALREAQEAIAVAWESAPGLDSPWVEAVMRHYGGDSVRALGTIMPAVRGPDRLRVAAAYTRLAPDSSQGYQVRFAAALGALRTGDVRPADALAEAGRYIRRQPDDFLGWSWAAIAAHRLAEHERAMRFWERVLVLHPNYFAGFDNRAPGFLDYRHWRRRVPRQPPATLADLPPA